MVQEHSKLGLASFGISICAILVDFAYILDTVLGYDPKTKTFSSSPWLNAVICLGVILPVVAFVIGMFGLREKNRKMIFLSIGLALSVLSAMLFFGFMFGSLALFTAL